MKRFAIRIWVVIFGAAVFLRLMMSRKARDEMVKKGHL